MDLLRFFSLLTKLTKTLVFLQSIKIPHNIPSTNALPAMNEHFPLPKKKKKYREIIHISGFLLNSDTKNPSFWTFHFEYLST